MQITARPITAATYDMRFRTLLSFMLPPIGFALKSSSRHKKAQEAQMIFFSFCAFVAIPR
jgi:hypothetical protein